MRRIINHFLLMLQILTRVPINKSLPCEPEDFGKGSHYFAFIGLLIGLVQYGIYLGGIQILPLNMVVILLLVFEVMITGGLHLDGFGDTCDGFFASKGKDKIIEIMKDSRIGAFACIGLIFNILLKYGAYNNLLWGEGHPGILIILPMLSRFSMVLFSKIGTAAKESGIGNLFINTVTWKEVTSNVLFSGVILFLLVGGWKTLIILGTTLMITYGFNRFCDKKINGITGDSLGANHELTTLGILLIIQIVV